MGPDQGPDLSFPIGQMRRNKELALSAFFHAYESQVPTLDDPSGAEDKLKRFSFLMRGIKERPIGEESFVMSEAQGPAGDFFSGSGSVIGDFKFFHSSMIIDTNLSHKHGVKKQILRKTWKLPGMRLRMGT